MIIGGGVLATRITVNKNEVKSGRALSYPEELASMGGYVLIKLGANTDVNICIEYKSAKEWKMNPADEK